MSNRTMTRSRNEHDALALARTFLGFDPFLGLQTRASKAGFAPAFEARETENAYIITGDVPGISEDNLDISTHNNLLTISGTRSADKKQEGDTYFVYERQYGSFSRSFTLPEAADSNAIEAELKNGVLTLTIGKKAESRPRKIALKK